MRPMLSSWDLRLFPNVPDGGGVAMGLDCDESFSAQSFSLIFCRTSMMLKQPALSVTQ